MNFWDRAWLVTRALLLLLIKFVLIFSTVITTVTVFGLAYVFIHNKSMVGVVGLTLFPFFVGWTAENVVMALLTPKLLPESVKKVANNG
jgi:hypothetical protein